MKNLGIVTCSDKVNGIIYALSFIKILGKTTQ